jgi:hypothetical protein
MMKTLAASGGVPRAAFTMPADEVAAIQRCFPGRVPAWLKAAPGMVNAIPET